MSNPSLNAGFSAVELLITLFIAAAFVATGFQLYGIIINDGGKSRAQARANNIAYDALRKYSSLYNNPCSPTTTPSPAPTIPAGSNLTNPSITVTITCPYGDGQPVSKINVSVRYGNPQQEIVHAIIATN